MIPSMKGHRPYRAPTGLPKDRDDWRMGSVVSALVHLGIILLLFTPMGLVEHLREIEQGAGGPGPAGGGGGGTRGSGALRAEMLRFVRVAPAEPAPPVPQPKVELPTPKVEPPKIQLTLPEVAPPPMPTQALPVGTGGGTGADGTSGTGPGTGGGVGTGAGTGRGSGLGPGTGGGNQANYPPTPIEIFIPPLPVPGSVKGHHLVAEFDVDETGRVLDLKFNETKDRGYNRKLAEVFRGFRFRPGTTPDGRPLRMKAQIVVDLY